MAYIGQCMPFYFYINKQSCSLMRIEELTGTIIDGQQGGGYQEDELLTAEEFNKIPRKINELITTSNKMSELDIPILQDAVYTLNNAITGDGEINAHVELADRSVTDITQNSELCLKYDQDGKLYIEKIIPFAPRISATTSSSFVIDSGSQSTRIKITKTGTDDIDTSTINIHVSSGTFTGNGTEWTVYTSQDTTVYAEVNGMTTNTLNITFNQKQAATFWSTEILTPQKIQSDEGTGFNIKPSTSIKGRNIFVSDQKHFSARHPDDTTMYYLYLLTTVDYVEPNDIRQHMFIDNSSVGGGLVHVGQVTQYSTNIVYHVYRTSLKYDTEKIIDIK